MKTINASLSPSHFVNSHCICWPVRRMMLIVGGITLAALIPVNGQPTATTQPKDQFVDLGKNVFFNILSPSAPPLTYQWFFNSLELLGATNRTLPLTNAQPTLTGDYFAVVSNTSGSVTSQVARLKVFVPAAHNFSTITITPNRSVALELAGDTTAAYAPFYDLFPVEVSSNLIDWSPLVTLIRTNTSANALSYTDFDAEVLAQRFYRTFTNSLTTIFSKPTGPYAVGTLDRVMNDPSRTNRYRIKTNSLFMATFWYPAQPEAGVLTERMLDPGVAPYSSVASSGGSVSIATNLHSHAFRGLRLATNQPSFPVLIYSCGGGGIRNDNTVLAVELASHGYIVVSAEHADDAEKLITGRPDVVGTGGRDFVPHYQSRYKDLEIVLAELETMDGTDELFAGRLALGKIGVIGWSTGGVSGAELCLEEDRVKAGVLLDPGFISFVPNLLNVGIQKPLLVITGIFDDGKQLFNKATGMAYWLRITGSTHLNMGDLPLYSANAVPVGSIESRRASQILQAYTLSFLNKHLLNSDDHLLDGPVALYPEVKTILKK